MEMISPFPKEWYWGQNTDVCGSPGQQTVQSKCLVMKMLRNRGLWDAEAVGGDDRALDNCDSTVGLAAVSSLFP